MLNTAGARLDGLAGILLASAIIAYPMVVLFVTLPLQRYDKQPLTQKIL